MLSRLVARVSSIHGRRTFSTSHVSTSTTEVVFVLGGPGSGKGTQCEAFIADVTSSKFSHPSVNDLFHINVGGLLRAELNLYKDQLATGVPAEQLSPYGATIQSLISTGKILPSWVTISLLHKALAAISENNPITKQNARNLVLVDGFPRSHENFVDFETQAGICKSLVVIDCSAEEMTRRVLHRGKSSGRSDDQSVDTIKSRIHVFDTETAGVINNFDVVTMPLKSDSQLQYDETVGNIVASTSDRLAVRVPGDLPADQVEIQFREACIALLDRQSNITLKKALKAATL